MLERQQRREAAAGLGCSAAFVTPPVSCDSDSGYSSVELEPPEWCQRGRLQQPQRAECDVRDVLAKRKRRVDAVTADHAAASAAKRLRVGYWPGENLTKLETAERWQCHAVFVPSQNCFQFILC